MDSTDFRAELAKLPRRGGKQDPGGLTERQALVLKFIAEFIASRRYSPSVREIGQAFGIKSTNAVDDYLCALRTKGRVDWTGNRARTLRVLP